MKAIFRESAFTLRTHLEKCSRLDVTTTQREYQKLSTEYGTSLLNELEYFNVCSGGIIQDVMHDVLEGTHCVMNVHVYSLL